MQSRNMPINESCPRPSLSLGPPPRTDKRDLQGGRLITRVKRAKLPGITGLITVNLSSRTWINMDDSPHASSPAFASASLHPPIGEGDCRPSPAPFHVHYDHSFENFPTISCPGGGNQATGPAYHAHKSSSDALTCYPAQLCHKPQSSCGFVLEA